MDYPYANGVVKAIDSNILDKGRLLRLAKNSQQEFLEALTDLGYGEQSSDIERVISADLAKSKALIELITPNKTYTDLFFMSYDAQNMKVLWKKRLFKIEGEGLLVNSGAILPQVMVKAVLDDDYTDLTLPMARLLEQIKKKVEHQKNPRLISAIIDDYVYSYALSQIGLTTDKSLTDYLLISIDFANVTTLVRSRKLGWDYDQFQQMFLHNGRIPKEVFGKAYKVDDQNLAGLFMPYYNEKITKSIKNYLEKKSLSFLEHSFAGIILENMAKYRYDAFKLGPLIYYYLRKQGEAKNIRLIYSNSNTISSDLLDY